VTTKLRELAETLVTQAMSENNDNREMHIDRKKWESSARKLPAVDDTENTVTVDHPTKGKVIAARWYPDRKDGWVNHSAHKD